MGRFKSVELFAQRVVELENSLEVQGYDYQQSHVQHSEVHTEPHDIHNRQRCEALVARSIRTLTGAQAWVWRKVRFDKWERRRVSTEHNRRVRAQHGDAGHYISPSVVDEWVRLADQRCEQVLADAGAWSNAREGGRVPQGEDGWDEPATGP